MFAQAQTDPNSFELVRHLRLRHGLTATITSNEAMKLKALRIRNLKSDTFVDFFGSSGFAHLRNPDTEIVRLVLDVSQTPDEQIGDLELTTSFVQVDEHLVPGSILHSDDEDTYAKLVAFGLQLEEGAFHDAG